MADHNRFAHLTAALLFGGAAIISGCGGGGGDGISNVAAQCTEGASVADVSGAVVLSDLVLVDSSCDPELDDSISDALSFGGSCDYEVEQDGNRIAMRNCSGIDYAGCVGADGLVSVSSTADAKEAGCHIGLESRLTSHLASVPAEAHFEMEFDFGGDCEGLQDCTLVLAGTFTKNDVMLNDEGTVFTTATIPIERADGVSSSAAAQAAGALLTHIGGGRGQN